MLAVMKKRALHVAINHHRVRVCAPGFRQDHRALPPRSTRPIEGLGERLDHPGFVGSPLPVFVAYTVVPS